MQEADAAKAEGKHDINMGRLPFLEVTFLLVPVGACACVHVLLDKCASSFSFHLENRVLRRTTTEKRKKQVDGAMIAQSKSIERFVAAKYGKSSARFLLCMRESISLFVLLFTGKSCALTHPPAETLQRNAENNIKIHSNTHCSTQC